MDIGQPVENESQAQRRIFQPDSLVKKIKFLSKNLNSQKLYFAGHFVNPKAPPLYGERIRRKFVKGPHIHAHDEVFSGLCRAATLTS
jgi:hypothetical protein